MRLVRQGVGLSFVIRPECKAGAVPCYAGQFHGLPCHAVPAVHV